MGSAPGSNMNGYFGTQKCQTMTLLFQTSNLLGAGKDPPARFIISYRTSAEYKSAQLINLDSSIQKSTLGYFLLLKVFLLLLLTSISMLP